jgi:hypothetical protein
VVAVGPILELSAQVWVDLKCKFGMLIQQQIALSCQFLPCSEAARQQNAAVALFENLVVFLRN